MYVGNKFNKLTKDFDHFGKVQMGRYQKIYFGGLILGKILKKVFILLHLKLRYYEKATKVKKVRNFCGLYRKPGIWFHHIVTSISHTWFPSCENNKTLSVSSGKYIVSKCIESSKRLELYKGQLNSEWIYEDRDFPK